MSIFSNVLMAVDADGTLLTDEKEILDIDKNAIREFRENGGLFTIATGRAVSYTRPIVRELGLDVPAVTTNGAMVYDFQSERVLWQSLLPQSARGLLLGIKDRYPSMGIDILRGEDLFSVSSNRHSEEHFRSICVTPIRCSLDEVPGDDWSKILLVDEPDVIADVAEYTAGLDGGGVYFVCSCPVFCEMLPQGTNKWGGIKKLLEVSGIDARYVVTAGDYLNDLEMVKMADLGVAVANALDMVRENADLVVCDNNNGAITEIVEWLMNKHAHW